MPNLGAFELLILFVICIIPLVLVGLLVWFAVARARTRTQTTPQVPLLRRNHPGRG